MSTPISAMRSWAARSETPGMVASWASCRPQGWHSSLTWAVTWSISVVYWSMRASIIFSSQAWWLVKKAQSRASRSWGIFARALLRASWARAAGSRSPAMMASSMARPDAPWMSDSTDDSLRWASSSSFSARCFSAVRAWTRCRR